ncbi:hypothetical protein R1sor_025601 [Riccia sorocarpa]|uniref:Uncharacterized protein n=1 Tax=Riccia sorocarpa TaxID=122646 RepID=A0ABD3G9K4_9MARC
MTSSSEIGKLEFERLSIHGENYEIWKSQCFNVLASKQLDGTIAEGYVIDGADPKARAQAFEALVIIMKHLPPALYKRFRLANSPSTVWKDLKDSYGNIEKLLQPAAIEAWNQLRFLDFKSAQEYDIALQDCTADLEACGLEVIWTDTFKMEKTLNTFPDEKSTYAANLRQRKFTKYQDLINEILYNEANERVRARVAKGTLNVNPGMTVPTASNPTPQVDTRSFYTQPQVGKGKKKQFKRQGFKSKGKKPGACRRCGLSGHWQSECRKSWDEVLELRQRRKEHTSSKTQDRPARHATTQAEEKTNLVIHEENPRMPVPEVEPFLIERNDETYMALVEDDRQLREQAQYCLVDSGTTQTILTDLEFFQSFTPRPTKITTVNNSSTSFGKGFGSAVIVLPSGQHIRIQRAMYAPHATRNLLSFLDLRKNGFELRTDEGKLVMEDRVNKKAVDSFEQLPNGLYQTAIQYPTGHTVQAMQVTSTLEHEEAVRRWHERLGHPSPDTLQKMVVHQAVRDLPLTRSMFTTNRFNTDMSLCVACARGKLIRKSHDSKQPTGISFLGRLHTDCCGPINPPFGKKRYFMPVIDECSRKTIVQLLESRDQAFAALVQMLLQMRTQFPDHPVQKIRLDNAGEFSSKLFESFCVANGIQVEYSTPHEHEQNGLAEAYIKQLQHVGRTLLMRCNLPAAMWGYAITHANDLMGYWPHSSLNYESPQQVTSGIVPSVRHFKTFGCTVYVPVSPPQRTKMGPQRQMGIYVGAVSRSIIKYLNELGQLFTARFDDCRFDEGTFPLVKGASSELLQIYPDWPGNVPVPPTSSTTREELGERGVILGPGMHREIVKAGTPAMTEPLKRGRGRPRKEINPLAMSQPKRQRGRPSELVPPMKETGDDTQIIGESSKAVPTKSVPTEVDVPLMRQEPTVIGIPDLNHPAHVDDEQLKNAANEEIVLCMCADDYVIYKPNGGIVWKRDQVKLDTQFAMAVAESIHDHEEPMSIAECKASADWPQWRVAIHSELKSLISKGVFRGPLSVPVSATLVDYRWVFVRKRGPDGKILRYKARLVARGFSQRPGFDFTTTYSPVMDLTTYRYLIAFSVQIACNIHVMDVVTAYLYGKLDTEIYMQVPVGISIPADLPRPGLLLVQALYGLKQSGRMWYQRLTSFLLSTGFKTLEINPCIFFRRQGSDFVIVAIYVDDLNLIGTRRGIEDAKSCLSSTFEMKDLGQVTFCLGLQFSRIAGGILVHQTQYLQKVLTKFSMIDCLPRNTPLEVRNLKLEQDIYGPRREGETILPAKYPYLAAIGSLMYAAMTTRPDIAFSVNLLARHSQEPTHRHWNGVKQIMRYLRGTMDVGLFYVPQEDSTMRGYADAGYLSDMTKGRSQTGFVFLKNGAAISWRSRKQTLAATSSTHAEMIALYEATRECVWIRRFTKQLYGELQLSQDEQPTPIFEDNAACRVQVKTRYIRSDTNKHLNPKFYFTSELDGKEINVESIASCDNVADLLTKILPRIQHQKLCCAIGLRSLSDLQHRLNSSTCT